MPIDSQSPVLPAGVPVGGGRLFDRFELRQKLGQGGMGQVWLAMDEVLHREVALKFLPELLVNDPAAIEELRAETRRALRLTHEGIVRTYDFYCDGHMACIAMEYISGGTLTQLRIKQPERMFEPDQILPWIEQTCDALHYAHTVAKVAHRDLKPSNIMIDDAGRVKVTDFGIARSLSDSVSRVSNRPNSSGTLPYMSPQQLYGEKPHPADDVYAMAATIFELLASKPPFYSGSVERQIIDRVAPSIAERRSELEIIGEPILPHWERVVAACLSKSREDRPQSMRELAAALADPALTSDSFVTVAASETEDLEVTKLGVPVTATIPASVPPIPAMCSPASSSISLAQAGVANPATNTSFQPATQTSSSSTRLIWLVLGLVAFLGFLTVGAGVFVVLKLREKNATPSSGVQEPRATVPAPAHPEAAQAEPAPAGPLPPARPAPTARAALPLPVIGSTCRGSFTYDDPNRVRPTNFSLTFTDVTPGAEPGQARIAGTMSETRADFGPEGMNPLPSTFVGSWQATAGGSRITFTKTYRFDSAPSEFSGSHDEATGRVSGTWDIHGYTGSFKLEGLTLQ